MHINPYESPASEENAASAAPARVARYLRLQGHFTLAAAVLTGFLAAADAWDNHDDIFIVAWLFVWASAPVFLASAVCYRGSRQLQSTGSMIAAAIFAISEGAGSIAIFTAFVLSPPPNPLGAAHMAPFLWPLLLFVLSLICTMAVSIVFRALAMVGLAE